MGGNLVSPTGEVLFEEKAIPLMDILIDSKPAKITEKDITFYREQIICLVCKGNVEGFNFICPSMMFPNRRILASTHSVTKYAPTEE